MRKPVSIFALLLAWLCANGAIWDVVQVAAWARMFSDYSKVMPAGRALALTFDGAKPCDLCVVAQDARDATRDSGSPAPLAATDKLVLVFQNAAPVVLTAPELSWPGPAHEAGSTRAEPVPVPPPRV